MAQKRNVKKTVNKNEAAVSQKRKKTVNIFLGIFFVSLVFFAVVGAFVIDNFSPLQQVEDLSKTEEDTYKGEIDDRLRFIAMQDDDKFAQNSIENERKDESDLQGDEQSADNTNSEDFDTPKNKFEQYNDKYRKKTPEELNKEKSDNDSDADIPPEKAHNAMSLKVVIGSFSTKEAAQEELLQLSSQFPAPPFIKYVNNAYSIQVASFKTPETAYEYVNSLRHQGYTARIIEE